MPERLTPLLFGFRLPKRDLDGKQGKFRAQYHYCVSRSQRQVANLKSIGCEVEAYRSCCGYTRDWRRFPPIEKLYLPLSQVVRQTQTPLLRRSCVMLREAV